MDEQKTVEIIYKLVDEISNQIKQVQTSIEETNKTADDTEGFDNLTGSIIKANLATQVLLKGFQLLESGIRGGVEILNAGGRFDMLNQSLNTVAGNLGYTKDQLKNYYQELENANTYGSKATEVLKSMLQTGLLPIIENLKFANGETGFKGLALTIKDFAASAGVSSSQAMDDFSKSIQRLEPLLLDKYFTMRNLNFVYQDYAASINKTLPELTEQEKRQAFLNEIVREGAVQMGVYADTYDTAGKNMLSLADISDSLKEEVGLQLQPAWKAFTNTLVTTIKGIRDLIKDNPQLISQLVTGAAVVGGLIVSFTVATKVVGGVTAAVTIAKAAFAALSVQITATQLAAGLLGVALAAIGALIAKNFMDQVSATQDAQNATEDLSGVTQDYFANAGAASDEYSEKLEDHAKKLQQIKDSIEEENQMFERQLTDIIMGREKDLAANKKSLEKELAQFDKTQEEKKKAYEENTQKIQEENAARLKNLEDTLGAELQIGSANYDQNLQNYLAAVEAEKIAGNQKLEVVKQQYEDDTSEAKAQLDERTSALQEKIKEDEDFLQKHADIVKSINRDVLQDEIEQLQQTHAKRLQALQDQLSEEQKKFATSNDIVGNDWRDTIRDMNNQKLDIAGMITPIDWGKVLGGAFSDLGRIAKQLMGGLAGAIVEIARKLALWIRDAIGKIPVVGGEIQKQLNSEAGINAMADQWLSDIGNWAGITAYARGTKYAKGGWTVVGEEGAEIVRLPQGAEVMNARDSKNALGGNVTIGSINIYATENQDPNDVAKEVMNQINTLMT